MNKNLDRKKCTALSDTISNLDYLRRAAIAIAAGLTMTTAAAQEPKPVPSSSIIDEAKQVRESVSLIGLTPEFVVTGDLYYDSYFVGAESLRFKPGARLIFSDKALALRNNLIVAAKRIVNEDPAHPGQITWNRKNYLPEGSPQSGQAPAGAHGQSDGASGGPGANGAIGIPGLNGQASPNLTLFMIAAAGAPPVLDLRGQDGGKGGQGQKGGDGGVGRQGNPASASLFDCKSGAGFGGNGGPGGSGGQGGRGGLGGKGGTVTLVSTPSAFPALLQLVRTNVSGGDAGEGGNGGIPGAGQPGAPQGSPALPYCKDEPGRRGSAGANGQSGSKGDKGNVGLQGDVNYATLTLDAFNTLFGSK